MPECDQEKKEGHASKEAVNSVISATVEASRCRSEYNFIRNKTS